jgi:arginine exporter protein ArgO
MEMMPPVTPLHWLLFFISVLVGPIFIIIIALSSQNLGINNQGINRIKIGAWSLLACFIAFTVFFIVNLGSYSFIYFSPLILEPLLLSGAFLCLYTALQLREK